MGKVPQIPVVWQVLIAVILTTARVGAEPPKEPPDEGARAKLLLRANEAMRDGRFAEARDGFLDIWEATGEHEAACNVGRLSYRVGDMPRAVEFLTLCVSYGTDPEHTVGARLELAHARRQVAEVRVRGPAGMDVTIDGRPRGRAPVVAYLAPGAHTIRGTRAPDLSAESTATIGAGESRVIELTPTRPPTVPRADDRILIAGAATSAVLFGTGAGLMGAVYFKESEGQDSASGNNGCYRAALPRCEDASDAYGTAVTLRNLAPAAFIAGGAIAAATISYALYPRRGLTVKTAGTGIEVRGAW